MIAQLDKHYLKLAKRRTFNRLVSYFLYEGRPVTTKGQWFNTITITWLKVFCIFLNGKRKNIPVFIVGTGRSGTTILGKILSAHSRIGWLNEPKVIWHLINKEDDIIGSYNKNGGKYILNESDYNLTQSKKINKIYQGYSIATNTHVVLDKYPEMIFRYNYIAKLLPDYKFIFLVRSGNDTCFSINNWSKKHGTENIEKHDWWGVDDLKWKILIRDLASNDSYFKNHIDALKQNSNHLERAAVEWILTMKKGIELQQVLGDRMLFIKYEDIVNNTETKLDQLQLFCNVKIEKQVNNYAKLVLESPKKYNELQLPQFIQTEFIQISKQLGYL